jgi:actin-related protein
MEHTQNITGSVSPVPQYQFYGSTEKNAIVIDLGTAYTKVGFSGEAQPRYIIPTKLLTQDGTQVQIITCHLQ